MQNDFCRISQHGGCCCVCTNRVEINKHPWNNTDFIKGDMSEFFAYGCALEFAEYINKEPGAQRRVIISDRMHGMCELFDPTKEFKGLLE